MNGFCFSFLYVCLAFPTNTNFDEALKKQGEKLESLRDKIEKLKEE